MPKHGDLRSPSHGAARQSSSCAANTLDACLALQRYITEIGALLPEAEAQPKSAAAQRAEQLGREAMYIGSCLAAGIPRHTRTLYCLKLQESGPENSRAPPQLWMAIMLQMNLSSTQREVQTRPSPPSSLSIYPYPYFQNGEA